MEKDDFKVINEPDAMSSRERRWVQVQKRLEINPEPYVECEGLKKEMDKWVFPLHFIDFGTDSRPCRLQAKYETCLRSDRNIS